MAPPGRQRINASNVLCMPAFDAGGLTRFDTARRTFVSFRISGEGGYETPRASNVSRQTSDMWMAASNSDHVPRFWSSAHGFLSYPGATHSCVLRDFAFNRGGGGLLKPVQPAGGRDRERRASFICTEPDGGEQDRLALAGVHSRQRTAATGPAACAVAH